MRPGAFAGIDVLLAVHKGCRKVAASMRPGANRRDHYPKIQRVCHLLTSFNEARARIAGITPQRFAHGRRVLSDASMRPGANRRELAASAVREMRTDRAAGVPARRAVGGSLISQGLLEGVCVTVTSAVDVATMTDANNRYE